MSTTTTTTTTANTANKRSVEEMENHVSSVPMDDASAYSGRVRLARMDKCYFANLFCNKDGSIMTSEQLDAQYKVEKRNFRGNEYLGLYAKKKIGCEDYPVRIVSPLALVCGAQSANGAGTDPEDLSKTKQLIRLIIDPESVMHEELEYPSTVNGVTTMKRVILENEIPGLAEEHRLFAEAMKAVSHWVASKMYEMPEAETFKAKARSTLEFIAEGPVTEDQVKAHVIDGWQTYSCLRREKIGDDGTPPTLVATSKPIFETKESSYPSPIKPGHLLNQARKLGLAYNPVPIMDRNGTQRNGPNSRGTDGKLLDPTRVIIKTDMVVQVDLTLKPNFSEKYASSSKAILKKMTTVLDYHNPNAVAKRVPRATEEGLEEEEGGVW